jgi:hypothetical protein
MKQQGLGEQELTALQLLCRTARSSMFCSEMAVIRKEVYRGLMYTKTGNSCSYIVKVEKENGI